jgi:TPR repeat protein
MAMTNLGVLYDNGHGVQQDYDKAREWFEKAADAGDETAESNLQELSITEAEKTGRYSDALKLSEALEAKDEQAETKQEGKPAAKTAMALNDVAWCALLSQDFTKALAAAVRAHGLLPENLMIEGNRAHALMFTGNLKDAEALYLAHKGEPIADLDNLLWERAVANDFADFRKAGLSHPMMNKIARKLGVGVEK